MDIKIYFLREKEIHMVGDAVGVCWNIHHTTRTIKGEDGLTYRAEVPVRDDDPYIDFVTIREEEGDTPWEDEDSPVEGGMDVEYAEEIVQELQWAIAYLRGMGIAKVGE
jgi:hypothetical protein